MKLGLRTFAFFASLVAFASVSFAENYDDYKAKIGGHLWDAQRGSVKSIHRQTDDGAVAPLSKVAKPEVAPEATQAEPEIYVKKLTPMTVDVQKKMPKNMGKNTAKTILNTMKASGVEVSEDMEKQLEEADVSKDPDSINKLMMQASGDIAGKSGMSVDKDGEDFYSAKDKIIGANDEEKSALKDKSKTQMDKSVKLIESSTGMSVDMIKSEVSRIKSNNNK